MNNTNTEAILNGIEQPEMHKLSSQSHSRNVHVYNENYIHGTATISDRVVITGDVTIGPNSVVFYGAMIQGDSAPITIGEGCCIVDNVVMHNEVKLGDFVHLAHSCIVHRKGTEGAVSIGSGTLVGFGTQIHASIGKGCQIAPGVVVDQPIPDYRFVHEKRMPDGMRKFIVSSMQPKTYQRIVAMYRSFWNRRTIIQGKLMPLQWHKTEGAHYCSTFKEALVKLTRYFNLSLRC